MKQSMLSFALCAALLTGCGKSESASDGANSGTPAASQAPAQGSPVDHSTMSSGSMESRMQAMNAEMVQHLGPADADYDHRFIDMMIQHHEGAILMARDALQKSQRPEIKQIAEKVITDQQREIAQLKGLGEQWYHKH